jgi:hypothetical protein
MPGRPFTQTELGTTSSTTLQVFSAVERMQYEAVAPGWQETHAPPQPPQTPSLGKPGGTVSGQDPRSQARLTAQTHCAHTASGSAPPGYWAQTSMGNETHNETPAKAARRFTRDNIETMADPFRT